jgi:hypothetical protein
MEPIHLLLVQVIELLGQTVEGGFVVVHLLLEDSERGLVMSTITGGSREPPLRGCPYPTSNHFLTLGYLLAWCQYCKMETGTWSLREPAESHTPQKWQHWVWGLVCFCLYGCVCGRI